METPKLPAIPTSRNLPYWIIFMLCSAIGGLLTYIVNSQDDCAKERRALTAEHKDELRVCNEARQQDAKEAAAKIQYYLLRQDSINNEHMNKLEKIKR